MLFDQNCNIRKKEGCTNLCVSVIDCDSNVDPWKNDNDINFINIKHNYVLINDNNNNVMINDVKDDDDDQLIPARVIKVISLRAANSISAQFATTFAK